MFLLELRLGTKRQGLAEIRTCNAICYGQSLIVLIQASFSKLIVVVTLSRDIKIQYDMCYYNNPLSLLSGNGTMLETSPIMWTTVYALCSYIHTINKLVQIKYILQPMLFISRRGH